MWKTVRSVVWNTIIFGLLATGVLLAIMHFADAGIFGDKKAPFDFQSTDSLFIEYADFDSEFVAICKVNAEDKIEKCWLVEWEKTKECIEDAIQKKPRPTPTPTPYIMDNKPKK